MPAVVKTSLSASGTPASGDAGAVAGGARVVDGPGLRERPLGVDVQEGVHGRVDGGDPVEVGLGDLDGRDLAGRGSSRRASAAVSRGRAPSCLLPQDLRNAEPAVLDGRGAGERLRLGETRARRSSGRKTFVSGTACEVGGMSSGGDLADAGDRAEDDVELAGEQCRARRR